APGRLSGVCGRTLVWSLSTRETVWCDTPARRATSAITGGLDRPVCAGAISRLPGLPLPPRVPPPAPASAGRSCVAPRCPRSGPTVYAYPALLPLTSVWVNDGSPPAGNRFLQLAATRA